MDIKTVDIDLNNLKEKYTFNKLAKNTNGSLLCESGDAVILVTITLDERKTDDDFIPLSVQYIEKIYAGAKIPGGFIKREGKLSNYELLVSRLVDRAIRPLFPKNFKYNTVISITVLSGDSSIDMQLLTINAVSATLFISNLPINKLITGIRIGKVNNNLIINPTAKKQRESSLNLLLVATKENNILIEMSAKSLIIKNSENDIYQDCNEIDEEELISIIKDNKKLLDQALDIYEENFTEMKKPPISLENESIEEEDEYNRIISSYEEEINKYIKDISYNGDIKIFFRTVNSILKKENNIDRNYLIKILNKYKKRRVRSLILEDSNRLDGRSFSEIRNIMIDTNFLASVHGSTLFSRSGTQVLATVTTGNIKDAQIYEVLTSKRNLNETFMLHYNSAPFSTGDAKTMKNVTRKELGDGNLVKTSIQPTLLLREGTLRVVSELLESNGSSAMTSVCASSLALKSASIKTAELVAGISMGLIIDDSKYKILSDITNIETLSADINFNIAGTKLGITTLQMDLINSNASCSIEIFSELLQQAKEGRLKTLEIMELSEKKIVPSQAIPLETVFVINPRTIPILIGKGGKNIRAIASKYNIGIDISRTNSEIKIKGNDMNKITEAKEYIENMAFEFLNREMENNQSYKY